MAAKVSTYGERAEDIFFVNSRDRAQPITDKAQLACLEQSIVRRLTPPSVTPRAAAF
jgi:[protein-PII] uridylyltransferase